MVEKRDQAMSRFHKKLSQKRHPSRAQRRRVLRPSYPRACLGANEALLPKMFLDKGSHRDRDRQGTEAPQVTVDSRLVVGYST